MSESLFPTFRKISQTPIRDILRCRLTSRLDWKSQLAAANLPAPAAELIAHVVQRTRLFRLEKAAVADELTSHFLDGLAAGASTTDLLEHFGDQRTAARLIRRAKRRGRPVLWHVWKLCFGLTVIFVGIYVVLLIRFAIGRPTLAVDYVALLNKPELTAPVKDRAWPLWREAILAASTGMNEGNLVFPKEIGGGNDPDAKPTWEETASWLNHHTQAVELARQAAAKPTFGFVFGPGGSQTDPALFGSSISNQSPGQPFMALLLPHLNYMRMMGMLLSIDAKLAASIGDGVRCHSDLQALIGLTRQLRHSDGTVVTYLVALGVDAVMIDRLQRTINHFPGLLKEDQLIELAHQIAGPRVAGDLVQLQVERYVFHDIVQHLFTDDGHGDGHMTLKGVRSASYYITTEGPTRDPWDDMDWNTYALTSPIPIATVSRAEMIATYDRIMDRFAAAMSLPTRQVDFEKVNEELKAFKRSPLDRARYGPLLGLIFRFDALQTTCERYLGERDGAIVAIALELYHRRHGHYPASLIELTPELLPEIPADRITGEPIRYRLIEGKPIIYSVGVDRTDDDGKTPEQMLPYTTSANRLNNTRWRAAQWEKQDVMPRGDWVLYPSETSDQQ